MCRILYLNIYIYIYVAVEGKFMLMIRIQITILTPAHFVPVSSQDLEFHRHISRFFLLWPETVLSCSRTSRSAFAFNVYSQPFIVCVINIFYCHKNSWTVQIYNSLIPSHRAIYKYQQFKCQAVLYT